MQISEITFTVSSTGNLEIPESVLRSMKLEPGSQVRVAYLTQDGEKNTFREFLLSGDSLEALSEEQQIHVPDQLLEQANIPPDADLQIMCLNGLIIICRDPALSPDELFAVLESLQEANALTGGLPTDVEQLKEEIRQIRKGVDLHDM